MSAYLPVTTHEIVNDLIAAAANTGAAIIHLHARDPRDGRPTPDPAVFMQNLPHIKAGCDAVMINILQRRHRHERRGAMARRAPGQTRAGVRSTWAVN